DFAATDDEPTSPGRPAPTRPPAGAPTVRKSVARPPAPASSPTELLGLREDTAVIWTDEAGNQTFRINFHDEVFSNLACSIAFIDGRVVATFTVQDDNTRRLLEAEKGRLRASLEARGLRVQDVRVVRAEA
ncbi:MAG TPA: flagellar hook-length control protein FliK, partial [Myxococcota bacterium]|nr:flagellar hook-length control protein FliK [Myxococcota bacterium]